VLTILNSAVIPEVAHLQETGDFEAIKGLYIRLVRFAYLILLPILAGFYVFIDILLRLWVGERFVPYSYLSIIILSVYLLLPLGSIASTMVVGLEKIRQTIWIPITTTVVNIVVSVALGVGRVIGRDAGGRRFGGDTVSVFHETDAVVRHDGNYQAPGGHFRRRHGSIRRVYRSPDAPDRHAVPSDGHRRRHFRREFPCHISFSPDRKRENILQGVHPTPRLSLSRHHA